MIKRCAIERRYRVRPDDPALIMVLLDRRGGQAGNSDAVATHLKKLRLAVYVQECGIHRLTVFCSKDENMTDFDTALDCEHALAVR